MSRVKAFFNNITGGAPWLPLAILFGIALVDEMDRTAVGVLGPEIRDFFGLDITMVTVVVSLTGVLTILLALPAGFLADRVNRTKLSALGAFLIGVFGVFTGLAPTVLLFAVTRALAGLGRTLDPAHTSLLADYYPPDARAGVYAWRQIALQLGQALGPLLAGACAAFLVWQVTFLVIAIPAGVFAYLAFTMLREPVRGEQERRAQGFVEEDALEGERPPSLGESLRIAWNVRTLRRILYSLPFLVGPGLGIVFLQSLYFQDVFHVGAGERGVIAALNQPFAIAGLLIGSSIANRLLRDRPGRAITLGGVTAIIAGLSLGAFAIAPVLAVAVALGWVFWLSATIIGPASQALLSMVIPPRARALGLGMGFAAIIPGYLIFIMAGAIGDHFGLRGGIFVLVPVFMIGAVILTTAGSSVDADIRAAMAAALAAKISRDAKAEGDAKLLVCTDLDVNYGPVKVLFNVDFEVREGETIALLGTNGAGKSTLLRAISGLTPPSNGAIFYDGEDITYLPAHEHAARGIVQVPGGKGTFPGLTVGENLRLAAWMYRSDDEYVKAATEDVFGYFPILRERVNEEAGNLSGGEQQMLTLGQAFLSRSRLLMIDELSLGLAPAVVEQLLGIVRAIREQGTTIILVEQSVNVALTVAERAVFMEKGEVRFTGPTEELLRRPDILRSVYLRGTSAGRGAVAVRTGDLDLDGSAETDIALEVRGISRRYGGIQALEDVSFTLKDGAALGLIGPNGAGKTTLFDVISGFVTPSYGVVELFGEDITKLTPDQRVGRGLVRSFQDARLFPSLTVAENIAIALERHIEVRSATMAALHLPNVRRAEAKVHRRVDRLIELFALGSTRDKFVRELSTGQRRIVDIACILAAEPRVVLLDEPSSGIAQKEAEELGPLLHRIRFETGCSMLIIEHDMPLIMAVSDELLALDLGRVITRGEPNAVIEHPHVVASYLGDKQDVLATP